MSYAGELKLLFDGPAELCSALIPAARVLVQQTISMYGISSTNKVYAANIKTFKNGDVIAVIIAPNSIPEATIVTKVLSSTPYSYTEELEVGTPFVAAYGFVGPVEGDTDSGVGSPLHDAALSTLPSPLPVNYRVVPPPTWQLLPDGPNRVWHSTFQGTTDKFVEYLVSNSIVTEGVSGEAFLSEGIAGDALSAGRAVWRAVLEYPGLGEGYSRSEQSPSIGGYDPVFGPTGEASVDKVIAEGELIAIDGGVGSGPTRYTFDGLPENLDGLPSGAGASLAVNEWVSNYDVAGYIAREWSTADTFIGTGLIALPAYATQEGAADKFTAYTPYGEWVLAAADNSIAEMAGRVRPDGTLEGFPDEVLVLDKPTTVELHVRGAWGLVRVDVGIVAPSGEVTWPVPPIKRPIPYAVTAVPPEEVIVTAVIDPLDVEALEAGTLERMVTVSYDTGTYYRPSTNVKCRVYRMTTPNLVTEGTPLYKGNMSRQIAHSAVSTPIPITAYIAEGAEATGSYPVAELNYTRDLQFNPNVSSGGSYGLTYVVGASCDEPGFFVDASNSTQGSTAATGTMSIEVNGAQIDVVRELSDSYYCTYTFSDSGKGLVYGSPGGSYYFVAEPMNYDGLSLGTASRSYEAGTDHYTEKLTINGVEVDLIAVAQEVSNYGVATFISRYGSESYNRAIGFRDFTIKAVRVVKVGAFIDVTVVTGRAAYSVVYTSDGWVRANAQTSTLAVINEVYQANQKFTEYPRSIYAHAVDADVGNVT